MNIYEEIKKCFPGKSVSLHVVHNKDKTITTLIEPKITEDDEKFNHPIVFTTDSDDTDGAGELLKEAFEKIAASKIPDILGGESISGIDKAEEQAEEEEGGKSKKSTPKSESKKKDKKDAPAKTKAAPKKKEEKPKAEKPPKPTKEQIAAEKKMKNITDKFEAVYNKKDKELCKFWLDEAKKVQPETDGSWNGHITEMAEKLDELETLKEEIAEGDGIEKQIQSPDSVIKTEENNPILEEQLQEQKEENKTDSSNDENSVPMPM